MMRQKLLQKHSLIFEIFEIFEKKHCFARRGIICFLRKTNDPPAIHTYVYIHIHIYIHTNFLKKLFGGQLNFYGGGNQ